MDGLKLARFVRDRWPPIKIVATSVMLRSTKTIARRQRLPAEAVPRAEVVATLREMTSAA